MGQLFFALLVILVIVYAPAVGVPLLIGLIVIDVATGGAIEDAIESSQEE